MGGRILAIDYGKRHWGIALSDSTGTISQPFSVLSHPSFRKKLEEVFSLITEYQVKGIVIGVPFRTDGKSSPAVEEVYKVGEILKRRAGIPVDFFSEQYSSRWAERVKKDLPRKRRGWEHALSAQAILYDYLKFRVSC
jgi:putative Holliday junction resolvase